jgi:hypothetical protein
MHFSHSFQPPALVLLERIPAGDTTSPLTLLVAARLSGLVRLGRSCPLAQSATSCAHRLVRSPAARHALGGQRHARKMRSVSVASALRDIGWIHRQRQWGEATGGTCACQTSGFCTRRPASQSVVRYESPAEKGYFSAPPEGVPHRDKVTSKRESECGPPRAFKPRPAPILNGIGYDDCCSAARKSMST